MKESASSFCQSGSEGQEAGAHAGLTHPLSGPLGTASSAGSEQAAAQAGRKAVAPLVARFLPELDKYEVVDANDLVVTRPIIGEHSAKAILTTLQRYVLGGGLCLKHLTELYAGRCLSCSQGWMRHTFSAEAR